MPMIAGINRIILLMILQNLLDRHVSICALCLFRGLSTLASNRQVLFFQSHMSNVLIIFLDSCYCCTANTSTMRLIQWPTVFCHYSISTAIACLNQNFNFLPAPGCSRICNEPLVCCCPSMFGSPPFAEFITSMTSLNLLRDIFLR
jgi:hypothetical protein